MQENYTEVKLLINDFRYFSDNYQLNAENSLRVRTFQKYMI